MRHVTSYFKPFVTPTGRKRRNSGTRGGVFSSTSFYAAPVRITHCCEQSRQLKIPSRALDRVQTLRLTPWCCAGERGHCWSCAAGTIVFLEPTTRKSAVYFSNGAKLLTVGSEGTRLSKFARIMLPVQKTLNESSAPYIVRHMWGWVSRSSLNNTKRSVIQSLKGKCGIFFISKHLLLGLYTINFVYHRLW